MCILPPEVIIHILTFLSPRDVVQLRLVSKQFHDLTYDIEIWRTLYTNARLPRPPGPFPSQSFLFLERTLVQSECVAQSWTTQPMRDVSTVLIETQEQLSFSPIILHGRWLVGCESSSKFVAHDLDSNAGPPRQLLWESALQIDILDVCPAVSTSGLLIHIMFRSGATEESLVPWNLKLLQFRVSGDSLLHTLTLDIPTSKKGNPTYLDGGRTPFCYIDQQSIFDAETQSFYEFCREFSSELVSFDFNSTDRAPRDLLLTKTHVIAVFHHYGHTDTKTLIQAFTPPVHNSTGVLRLSHEGVTPGHVKNLDLIRNSIVDPVSGATNIRLLYQFFEGDNLHFSCIDLVLPRNSSADTVLPMTINVQEIAHVNHAPFLLTIGQRCYIESSDDGYVRGFWRIVMPHDHSGEVASPFPTMRFSIDASGDKCVAVLGQISVPQWRQIHDPPWSRSLCFDGVKGRLYYERIRYILGVDDDDAVIIDLK